MCERSFLINGHTLNLVLIERLFSVEFHFGDHLYHPQRSWGKVICSEVCIKNSVHGGSPGPHPGGRLRGLAMGGLQAHTQGGGWGVFSEGGLQAHIFRGKLRGMAMGGLQAHTQGGGWGVFTSTCPGGRLRDHGQGGVQAHTQRGS